MTVAHIGNARAVRAAQENDSGIYFPVSTCPLQDILDPNLSLIAPDQQVVVREDTKQIIHVPKSRFHLLKNEDIFPLLEEGITKSSIDMSGMIVKDNMAYNGGLTVRTYTFPAHIAEPVVGDITQLEMKVINSYNGGSQFKAHIGGNRLACLNGMVLPTSQLNLIGARHTKGLGIKLPELVNKMVSALEIFNANTKSWGLLAETDISDADATRIIQSLPQINEKLEHRLRALWLDHKEELGPTMWALYNTLTYWSTHEDIRSASEGNAPAIVLDRESKVERVIGSALWNNTINRNAA